MLNCLPFPDAVQLEIGPSWAPFRICFRVGRRLSPDAASHSRLPSENSPILDTDFPAIHCKMVQSRVSKRTVLLLFLPDSRTKHGRLGLSNCVLYRFFHASSGFFPSSHIRCTDLAAFNINLFLQKRNIINIVK